LPSTPRLPFTGAAGRVLRNRSVVISNGAVGWLLIGATVAVVLVAAYLLLDASDGERSWAGPLAEHPFEAVTLIASLVLTPLGLWRAFRERVVLEAGAIRFEPGFPLPWSQSWTVHLHDLESASVEAAPWLPLPATWNLRLHARSGHRSLRVFQWVDPNAFEPKDYRSLQRGVQAADEIGELLQRTPLVAFLRDAGFDVTAPSLATTPESAMTTTSVAVSGALIVMLAAIGYALVEMVLLNETYAGPLPWIWMAGAGGLAGVATYAALHRDPVDRAGRIVLALLMTASFVGASFFGLLRLNAVLDEGGPQPYAYVHGADDRVVPVASDSPELDLPYLLSNFPDSQPGDVYELWLRLGPLGWAQLDLERFEQSVRAAETKERTL
jgi:hypothetical protein